MLAFIFPSYLWLLLLLPILWALAFLPPRRLPAWRWWSSLLLRTAGVLALVLALAGAQFVSPLPDRYVVFLLDGSDSVPLSQRAQAEAYIQQALEHLPPDDRAGIVVFGERALVERLPEHDRLLGRLASTPSGGQTDIQAAIQLGAALLPAEAQGRLVLLSDGGENQGQAREAARLAAVRGIPIDIVPLGGGADGLDAEVSGLELPAVVSEGQQVRLVVRVQSSAPAAARLLVQQRPFAMTEESSRQPRTLFDEQVQLTGEPQRFELTLPPPGADAVFQHYVVRLQAPGDARPQNDAAEAFSLVRGRPRVLLVEGTPDAGRNLAQALAAADISTETLPPQELPATPGGLVAYDAVVLVDVPEIDVSERAAGNLAAYVRDLGRGLLMVGGPQSFGAGGWRDTPLEAALPVDMDVLSKVRTPPVSIVVVIDVSGSMAAEEDGVTKVRLAAAAAARVAENIRDEDELTVIPFDSAEQGTVGPLPGSQRAEAIDRITRIDAGGGGIEMHDALQTAARFIRQSDKPIRHIITLTDGSDTVQQEGAPELVDSLRAEGVTVSSIAIGDGKDVPFLEDIVERGRGRFFLTEQASDLPDILANETELVIEPFIIEESFTPHRHGAHPILQGSSDLPPLHGYIATSPKDSAQVLLSAERGDPLLVAWQYGLGRSLAWTSDMRGQWGKDFVRWSGYPRMAARMLAWLLPAPDTQKMTLETQVVDGQLVLQAQVRDQAGGPAAGLRVAGQMVRTGGSSRDVLLHEVGPGSYRLAVQDMPPGVYVVHLLASDEQGTPQASITGGAAVPFSAEYRGGAGNMALLDSLAAMTGGRTNPAPRAVSADTGQHHGLVREMGLTLLWLALLLLPLDVAIRRLSGPRQRFRQAARQRAPTPSQAAQPPAPRAAAAPALPPAEAADPLERMRAAQERARKRARGEE